MVPSYQHNLKVSLHVTKMTSHILRNTRLYTRQLNEKEMDILAAWLETLDPVNPGEEAAEVTVVLHHSLRQNDRINAASTSSKTRPENFTIDSVPYHSITRLVESHNKYDNSNGNCLSETRSEGNTSPDWKSNSRQIKSSRPPPIFIPGVPKLPEIKRYAKVDSIDERISHEIIKMTSSGTTPTTAIRSHCPPMILSNDRAREDHSSPIHSNAPIQYGKQDSRVAKWLQNTASNSSYGRYESHKSSSKENSTLPTGPHDSTNDPAILALMTAVVEEKKVEDARTSPRLMSSEGINHARSNTSTSSRDRNMPANHRPRGYPYLKSDFHRDTAAGRIGNYQPGLPLAYSRI